MWPNFLGKICDFLFKLRLLERPNLPLQIPLQVRGFLAIDFVFDGLLFSYRSPRQSFRCFSVWCGSGACPRCQSFCNNTGTGNSGSCSSSCTIWRSHYRPISFWCYNSAYSFPFWGTSSYRPHHFSLWYFSFWYHKPIWSVLHMHAQCSFLPIVSATQPAAAPPPAAPFGTSPFAAPAPTMTAAPFGAAPFGTGLSFAVPYRRLTRCGRRDWSRNRSRRAGGRCSDPPAASCTAGHYAWCSRAPSGLHHHWSVAQRTTSRHGRGHADSRVRPAREGYGFRVGSLWHRAP